MNDPGGDLRCAVCKVLWHPATGMLVGHPVSFPFCGRHAREAMATMRWATSRKPKRGQPDFYESAGRRVDES